MASQRTETIVQTLEHRTPAAVAQSLNDCTRSTTHLSLQENVASCFYHSEADLLPTTIVRRRHSAIKQRPPRSRRSFRETRYVFYPPTLLQMLGISYGMQITSRSTAGWQYTLNIFRAVPENAPIFQFCRDGNLPAVRTLLTTGNASVWDLDPMGRTPLSVCIQQAQTCVLMVLVKEFH